MAAHKQLITCLLVLLTALCALPASQSSAQAAPAISIDNAAQVAQVGMLGRGIVKSLRWLPDSKRLAVGSTAGAWVYAVEMPDAQPALLPFTNPEITISSDGKWLASTTKKAFQVVDMTTGQLQLAVNDNADITSLEFSPDGTRLVVASWKLTVWDVAGGKQLAQFGDIHYASTQFNEDGSQLVLGTQDGLRVYDTKTWQVGTVIPAKGWSRVFTPAENLFVGRIGNKIELWNTKYRISSIDSATYHDEYEDIALSPDRTTIATTAENNASTVVLWTLKTGNRRLLRGNTGRIVRLAYSADGKTLLTLTNASEVRLWDTTSQKELLHLETGAATLFDVQLSPDSRYIAAFDDQSSIRAWDAQNGQQIAVWTDQTKPFSTLDVRSDGTQIATGSLFGYAPLWAQKNDKGIVYTWDTTTLTRKATLTGNAAIIRRVAYSPDGTLLAAAVADGSIRLWDTQPNGEAE